MNRERYKTRIRREAKLAARGGAAPKSRRQRPVPESAETRNIRKIHTWLRLGRGPNYIAAVPRDMHEIIAHMLIDREVERLDEQTIERYTMFGVQHNPYGPAYIRRDSTSCDVSYYSYGLLHRVYEPATIHISPGTNRLTWYVRGQPARPHGWPTMVERYVGGCTATWMPEGRKIQMEYMRGMWTETLTVGGDIRTVTDPMTGLAVRRAGTGGIFRMIPGG